MPALASPPSENPILLNEECVSTEVRGRLGIVTLARPKALNALNHGMISAIGSALKRWAACATVDAVVLRSSSRKAFCAGGDIKAIGAPPNPEDRLSLGRPFFTDEYKVNLTINTYPKPIVALIDGIAMGGGLGLSMHASHRVVSEDTRMAMPENLIGFFPDVGSAWFLNRCPGYLGRYLALTGASINSAFALRGGLATHCIPYQSFQNAIDDLAQSADLSDTGVSRVLGRHRSSQALAEAPQSMEEIDTLFSGENLDAVMSRVAQASGNAAWIEDANLNLHASSPTSLRLTWQRMLQAPAQNLRQILEQDLHDALRMIARQDFFEGVHARLVRKSGAPSWQADT